MQPLLVAVYCGFVAIGLGAALLGWIGRPVQAFASLSLSLFGLLGSALLARGPNGTEIVLPGWLIASGVAVIILAGVSVALGIICRRGRPTARSEPDYAAIGRERLAELDAVVAANRASRKRF